MQVSIARNPSPTGHSDDTVVENSIHHLESAFVDAGISSSRDIRKRIYLIEANSGLRARIAQMIFADGLHAEIFSSIGEFLQFGATEVGVIVVNDNLDGEGGGSIVERLNRARVRMPVIVYSKHATITRAISVIRSGAVNFISLNNIATKLRGAVGSISTAVENQYNRQSQVDELAERIRSLSNRESQVLDLLASGLSNKEIAQELEISPRTVEIHRMKMLSKLAARTSVDAVRIWCSVASGVYIWPIKERHH